MTLEPCEPLPTPVPDAPAPRAIVELKGVRKRFGSTHVLTGLDLCVSEGRVHGLLGRNGAGKTTALRIIMGILGADGGDVALFGETTSRTTRAQKTRIGYVSQEQHFYPWMSCRDLGRFVSGFYPTWDDAEFGRLLETFDLPPKRSVSQLSGGMRVKLALALALAHRPELMVLDEPTAGLDPAARRELLEIVLMQARRDGRTTLFSSHVVEEVERIADTVAILDRGRLRYEGRIDLLRDRVRQVTLPPPRVVDGEAPAPSTGDELAMPPAGFEVLSDRSGSHGRTVVLEASPEAWTAADWAGAPVERMSLEDVFLAMTVGRMFGA